MGKILDRLEAIVARWFYLIALVVVLVGATIACAIEATVEKRVYEIPQGACYCPSCGMVMVIEGKEAGG